LRFRAPAPEAGRGLAETTELILRCGICGSLGLVLALAAGFIDESLSSCMVIAAPRRTPSSESYVSADASFSSFMHALGWWRACSGIALSYVPASMVILRDDFASGRPRNL
jgi:hypothetical protein